MANNQEFLCRVIKKCRSFGIDPIVFGGWAEEYHGKELWTHADIDFFNQTKLIWPKGELWEEVHWLGQHVKVANKSVLDFYCEKHAVVRKAYKYYCAEHL
jgi:hypothetical protein